MSKKVVILQHRLLHYRVDFFEHLRERCINDSIELHLVHGQASHFEKSKRDEGVITWANKVNNRYFRFNKIDLVWQPLPKLAWNADLIILMQENRILSNYLILFLRSFFPTKIAFWGHGANFQSNSPNGIRETWKKIISKKVDSWFAYTNITKEVLVNIGYPENRITVLNNAIDTNKFLYDYESISDIEILSIRESLGIPETAKVGIFCGSLYKDKKLDLLLESAEIINKTLDFHLIIIGSGPELNYLIDHSINKPWIHLVGVKKGREKALFFKISDVMLNPGLLGLHILDSFSIGIPLVSTLTAKHSPEIAYLENNFNGILTNDNPSDYSTAIRNLLVDEDFYNCIRNNAIKSGKIYTLDLMVDNFYIGIKRCLSF